MQQRLIKFTFICLLGTLFLRTLLLSLTNSSNLQENCQRPFFFHATPKTGSTSVRALLSKYATDCGRIPLTYDACDRGRSGCPRRHRVANCAKNYPASKHQSAFVFTLTRMRHCCPMFATDLNYVSNAFVDHFPLNEPENKDYYEKYYMQNHYRFTILREPIEQFLSYCAHVQRYGDSARPPCEHLTVDEPWTRDDVQDLIKMVTKFHEYNLEPNSYLRDGDRPLYYTLANHQSRYLGWDGNPETHDAVIEFALKLDYVGTTDTINEDLVEIKNDLQITSPTMFKSLDHLNKRTNEKPRLDKNVRTMIKDIQWADIKLYNAVLEMRKKRRV